MDNQHRKITGYRELTAEDILAMNKVKEIGIQLEDLFFQLKAEGADARWLAIGQSDLQKGLMAWTRSIAKPETF